MRDARPRQPRQGVVVDRVAVVGAQRRVVEGTEDVGGDRFPRLDEAMRLQFPIGKHHLREERASDAIDGVLEEDDTLEWIGRVREPVVEQERLAQRRRHLGDEDGVVGVHEWLALVRQHRVHGVSHLVREREGGIECVVVVHEHVRVDAVHRRRVGTRALAVVLVDVHPAAFEAGGKALLVLPAERRDGCHDPLHHLLIRVVLGEVHQRDRPVVQVIRVEPERAAPQLLVPLVGRDVGARRGDQVLDDGNGDVVAVESGLERRCVAARTRLVPVALQDAVVQRRIRVERHLEGAVVRLEGTGPIGLHPVGREQRPIARIGDLHLLAGSEFDRRKAHVRCRERFVCIVGDPRELRGEREQVLATLVEDVFLLPEQRFDHEAIERQPAVGIHPAAQRLEWQREDLGVEPRRRLPPLCEQQLHLLAPGPDLVVALILVVREGREVPHLVGQLAHGVALAQRVEQRRGAAGERTLARAVGLDAPFQVVIRLAPCFP